MNVNRTELSEIFGVTQKTIASYVDKGMPVIKHGGHGVRSIYETKDCIKWYVEHQIAKRFGTDNEHVTEVLNKEYEQARLARAQADGKEIENQIKTGELAPVDFLTKVLAHVLAQVTANLDAIPQKLKRRAVKLTATDLDIVKGIIAKAQNAAARSDIHLEELVEDYVRNKGGTQAPGEAAAAEPE